MVAMDIGERIKYLNSVGIVDDADSADTTDSAYVLYWMVNAQRCEFNHGIEYAIYMSNKLSKPLVVFFGAEVEYQYKRHRDFMFEGLRDVAEGLRNRGIRFVVSDCSGEAGVNKLSSSAVMIITDKPYIREEVAARDNILEQVSCSFVEVESNVLVPVEVVSNKEEYAASTIRRKLWSQISMGSFDFVEEEVGPNVYYHGYVMEELDLKNTLKEKEVELIGGSVEAHRKLEDFVENRLVNYALRSNPSEDWCSGLSPYLHFGQISPVEIYLRMNDVGSGGIDVSGFLEELIVRRELAFNFVYFNSNYDKFECLPNWARVSLGKHREDIREYLYSLDELESARTYDVYWNSAQRELVGSGLMHNYMRMYWGKKILEWSPSPEVAFASALYLNNKYSLDGFDPNSFAGVAWCFGKHDRPWKERSIFGMVRFMNDKGLVRKFKMGPYLEKWM
ncbi:MAG: deoxyribodipyrimidine photo-lyase [Fusobacteria bacterium]|nr:MAG: deoxyribodipyrimidine photo-lyase [Fusobacteriota bacterium]KAF0229286.1 MAG: deoxyribodipyrimidine [Fusobacteriota bacterium]